MDIKKLKQIIITWASNLGINCNVYLFGSQVKGTTKEDSDIDIAIEFPDVLSKEERTVLWCKNHRKWEEFLSKETRSEIDLELYEGDDSPRIKTALNESSILLFKRQAN